MPEHFFTLKTDKNIVNMEVMINGVPLFIPPDIHLDVAQPINQWIKPGDNLFTVYLTWPDETSYQPNWAMCKLWLGALQRHQQFGDVAPLIDFIWPLPAESVPVLPVTNNVSPESGESTAPTEYYPYETRINFWVEPADAPPSRLWQEATPILWDDKQKQIVIQRLTLLHKAFESRDLKLVTKFLEFKTVEVGGTYYRTPDEAKQSSSDLFESLLGSEWNIEPLTPENLEFNLLADDRVLLVSNYNGKPVLQISHPEATFSIPVYFSLIHDVWLIVR